MVVNKVVENLMHTGFSEYESRAYLCLLGSHPATAYEIAKGSGIPTSKIYEVMAKLEERGVVSVLGGARTKKYAPIEPEELVEGRRRTMQDTLDELKQGLIGLGSAPGVSYIWNISDYPYLIDKAARMIDKAGQTVLASIWSEEARELQGFIDGALRRGVKVAAIHFGRPFVTGSHIFHHPIHDTIYAEKGGRGIVLVADSSEALVGNVLPDGSVEGAYSSSRGFVTVAEDYIKHDIYVMKIVRRFDPGLKAAFGARYEKLRDVFSDEDNL